jgi:hypothetical protein
MDDKIKNMEYWKNKNNIPGFEVTKSSGVAPLKMASQQAMNLAGNVSMNNQKMQNYMKSQQTQQGMGQVGFGQQGYNPFGFYPPAMMAMMQQRNAMNQGAATNQPIQNPVVQPVQQPVQSPPVEDPNAALTMRKSPAKQAVTTGETIEDPKTIAGQNIIKGNSIIKGKDAAGKENFYYDTGGDDQIYIEDPKGLLEKYKDDLVPDYDFYFETTEDGYYRITGVDDKVDPIKK